MLKQGSVADLKSGIIPRADSHIVVTMRFYPRFLRKEMRDEFLCVLAPEKQLLSEFNAAQKKLGSHNPAFGEVDYERRFNLSPTAVGHLHRLADLSIQKDVYLLCICKLGDRCHREMLLLLANKLWKTETGEIFHDYPHFLARTAEFSEDQS